jgi:hypothetical protein
MRSRPQIRGLPDEGCHLRKFVIVPIFTIIFSLLCPHVFGQENLHGYGGTSSFGISATYSPDSSHILIGDSGQRRTWTAGGEYTHLLHRTPILRLDYEGSIMPVFEESDPTIIGTEYFAAGQPVISSQSPVRVQHTTSAPIAEIFSGVPLYALFSRQNTYAAALAPLGIRLSAMPHWKIQPSMALDLGFVVSARDIPLDDCSQFNYMFDLGPGLQFFKSAHTSLRAEYLYRHISNAGQGAQNPGIDQGVIRLTVSLHR